MGTAKELIKQFPDFGELKEEVNLPLSKVVKFLSRGVRIMGLS